MYKRYYVSSVHDNDPDTPTRQYLFDTESLDENSEHYPIAEIYGRDIELLPPLSEREDADVQLKNLHEKVAPWTLPGHNSEIARPVEPEPEPKPRAFSEPVATSEEAGAAGEGEGEEAAV